MESPVCVCVQDFVVHEEISNENQISNMRELEEEIKMCFSVGMEILEMDIPEEVMELLDIDYEDEEENVVFDDSNNSIFLEEERNIGGDYNSENEDTDESDYSSENEYDDESDYSSESEYDDNISNESSLKKFKVPKQINYKNYKKEVSLVLMKLKENMSIKKLISETSIPRSTLYSWKEHIKKNPEWLPFVKKRRQKYFTVEEDRNLYDEVVLAFGKDQFSNHDFRVIALKHFNNSVFKQTNPDFELEINDKYCHRWREKHGLSIRTFHYERRTPGSEEKSIEFRNKVRRAIEVYSPEYTLNMDETNWAVVPKSKKTWAIKGSDGVRYKRDKSIPEKLTFTSIATVSASGKKFKLASIAKGLTNVCHKQFNGIDTVKFHSKSGWCTKKVIVDYLRWLSGELQGRPAALIWDQFPVHMNEEINEIANSLNIEIIPVPEGMTGSEQPLDRFVFGAMKKTATTLIAKKRAEKAFIDYTLKSAAEIMVESWEKVSSSTLKRAWEHVMQ